MNGPTSRFRTLGIRLALSTPVLALGTTACEQAQVESEAASKDSAKADAGSAAPAPASQDAENKDREPAGKSLAASPSVKHDNFWKAFIYAEANPDAEPPGVNDWECELSDKHPRPVVLVHGTWVNQYDSFAKMAPLLSKAGWCLYSFNFGKGGDKLPMNARYGTKSLNDSVLELKAFTDKVLKETGADKVDMVGWSQGGVLIRSYLQDHGGADADDPDQNLVQRVVTLGAPHHGTTLSGIALLGNLLGITSGAAGILGQGPIDQAIGSEFLAKLNDGPDTMPGIHYTSIYTIYDQIANPVTNCLLKAGPGAEIHNVSIQDGCLIDFSDHLTLPFTDRVIALTAQALDPDTEYRIPCKPQFGSI